MLRYVWHHSDCGRAKTSSESGEAGIRASTLPPPKDPLHEGGLRVVNSGVPIQSSLREPVAILRLELLRHQSLTLSPLCEVI